ncbi:phosphatase PAP2 family protein [Candidatus Cloacimonadota bacterium]
MILGCLLQAQVFQVSKQVFIRDIIYWTCLDLGNNYAEEIVQKKLQDNEASNLNKNDIPWYDNWISFKYDKDLKKVSDYTYMSLLGTSLALTFHRKNFIENFLVLGEIMVAQSAVGKWVKTISARKRPYVYDTSSNRKNQNSFYSLHSSGAFAIATYTYYYYSKMHGRNYLLAALLYSGASATAVLRVASAQHFPSDVVAGALAGSLISYLICHKYESALKLSLTPGSIAISLNF